MPRLSKLSRSKSIHQPSTAPLPVFDFLAPAILESRFCVPRSQQGSELGRRCMTYLANRNTERIFFKAISRASLCNTHRSLHSVSSNSSQAQDRKQEERFQTKTRTSDKETRGPGAGDPVQNNVDSSSHPKVKKRAARRTVPDRPHDDNERQDLVLNAIKGLSTQRDEHITKKNVVDPLAAKHSPTPGNSADGKVLAHNFFSGRMTSKHTSASNGGKATEPDPRREGAVPTKDTRSWSRTRLVFGNVPGFNRSYHTRSRGLESKQKRFSEGSNLPLNFFDDVSALNKLARSPPQTTRRSPKSDQHGTAYRIFGKSSDALHHQSAAAVPATVEQAVGISEQLKLMHSVRELENQLERAKHKLETSIVGKAKKRSGQERLEASPADVQRTQPAVVLTKEDYMNLVDLYYYSHNSRFSPEATDGSPTPHVLNDYTFALSSDFSPGASAKEYINEDDVYESPLKKIEEMLRHRQLREVAVMQVFVDLLIDDYSSNRALYEAYKQLPDPGVAYLPRGILRLFLQRMSTPWTLSEKTMLRYLSLIDDMQRASIPISQAEWSSAVYLAGRAFSQITGQEVNAAFKVWRTMEREAGVQASHVTFNILFDIAVRAGKFALGDTILREMHSRNLRLNRLGRVSLMYYHGLRRDGDGVRKAYRDFVEAGEIVDTLVMNCVISSLLNAQEPQAAEQTYARMKNMQSRLRDSSDRDKDGTPYKRYPEPESHTIGEEMASNHIGRILEKAPRLRGTLPGHHQDLQNRMPLTPDHVTFRSMIAYHATVSGDLDRVTILLQEMTDIFQLPLQTITFQLLFKGFAIHGPVGGPQSAWSIKRLDMCWNACRAALKESETPRSSLSAARAQQDIDDLTDIQEDDRPPDELTLPSIPQLRAMIESNLPNVDLPLSRPPPRRLSDWSEFVLDLAAFPRERLKRLERFHATMFDSENTKMPHEKGGLHTFSSPFFQSVAYTAPEPQLDAEEGEYELPSPSSSGLLRKAEPADDEGSKSFSRRGREDAEGRPHQVVATRTLVCWLVRAYARNTKSRARVEELWGQIRKVYKPQDAMERESVVRVLSRCLRDCDREGNE